MIWLNFNPVPTSPHNFFPICSVSLFASLCLLHSFSFYLCVFVHVRWVLCFMRQVIRFRCFFNIYFFIWAWAWVRLTEWSSAKRNDYDDGDVDDGNDDNTTPQYHHFHSVCLSLSVFLFLSVDKMRVSIQTATASDDNYNNNNNKSIIYLLFILLLLHNNYRLAGIMGSSGWCNLLYHFSHIPTAAAGYNTMHEIHKLTAKSAAAEQKRKIFMLNNLQCISDSSF